MRVRDLILCALIAPLLHCGARAELIVRSGGAITAPDAALPDASLPDASSPDAATQACTLGPIVVLKRRMEPSFLLSLTAMPRGGYAYTMASGWSGLASPALVTVDANLVETGAIATPRLLTAHAIPGDDRLYAVTSERDPAMGTPVEHAFYRTNPRLEAQPLGALCMGCVARDRPVVMLDGSIAVPMSTGALDSGGAVFVATDSGTVGASLVGMDLRSPALLVMTSGLVAASQRADGALARVLFDRNGMGVRALPSVQTGFDGSSAPWLGLVRRDQVVAIGAARGGGRTALVTMVRWDGDALLNGPPSLARTIAGTGPTAINLSASVRLDRGWIAAAWGEVLSDQGAGPWITVVDADARPLLDAQLATEAVGNSQSFTIYTALAPHPEGFLLAWSGWHPLANYAIYARVVRCP